MKLYHGDCLEVMKKLKDKSVDMILCDLPYGTTACKWDVVIDFELLWLQYKRIIKDNGCIALFGSEPFSSHLRLSNLKMFKYDWIWKKTKAPNFLYGNKQPMKLSELISVFYFKQPTYNSQLQDVKAGISGNLFSSKSAMTREIVKNPLEKLVGKREGKRKLANNFIEMSNAWNGKQKRVHPTQKPVPLLEYLIKTYTKEKELVLDNCMGSGSTGVACKNLKRSFIGIELEKEYFNIAKERINGI